MAVTRVVIPSTDPRLKRHVHHDDRSWDYRLDTTGLPLASVKWTRVAPVFDQGNLGSCTGNAGDGCMGTAPFAGTIANPHYAEDETGAVALYSDATKIANPDDASQQYPPNDVGCDGLSIAKALTAAGEISGYQHTFTLVDALKALQLGPTIVGVPWFNSMFQPNADGVVTVDLATGVAGGHEFVADEFDASRDLVGFTNSWGTSWGANGRFYMSSADFGRLLAKQGDVVLFTPILFPAPKPTPVPSPVPNVDPDGTLALTAKPWAAKRHIGDNARMAVALSTWLKATGR